MRISDWSSDVCSSDLVPGVRFGKERHRANLSDHFGPVRLCLRIGVEKIVTVVSQPDHEIADPVALHFRACRAVGKTRSEEHTSELQSLMRISYAVFCLKNKNKIRQKQHSILRHLQTVIRQSEQYKNKKHIIRKPNTT